MPAKILIIGQGIAGTLLAWELRASGLPFLIVDAGHAEAASRVAAGLISPVTGRRFTKTWRVDALRPLAMETYAALERELRISLIEEFDAWRLFNDEREQMRWRARHLSGELAPYDLGALDMVEPAAWAHAPFGGGVFGGTVRIDFRALIEASRKRWRDEGVLLEKQISDGALQVTPEGVRFEGEVFRSVIFCTGAAAIPFAEKPLTPTARVGGEIIALSVNDWPSRTLINSGVWFLPIARGKLLCGASYRPPENPGTVESGAEWLDVQAARVLKIACKRTEIFSGWRNVTQDKLPIAGWLPNRAAVAGVFSALGSKGALFAPSLAKQWAAHLASEVPLDLAVSPLRSV